MSLLAPPVLCCTKALPVALLVELLVAELNVPVAFTLTTAAFVLVLYKLATILLQLDSALITEEQPLHTDATAACEGCEVATAGMPVITPLESVIEVYTVNGFS